MRTVLVVSPHFPPVNAPDLHRVRVSLPYFEEFGWRPVVLAVSPEATGRDIEEELLATVPPEIPVFRVGAIPEPLTRLFGIGTLAVRAFPALYRAGRRLLETEAVDLVYFSTTLFPTMVLGRVWKARTGVPFVVDLQDPWVGEYYETRPRRQRPRKYWLARRVHQVLERWTMRAVGGIVAVSSAYHEAVRARYPWIRAEVCDTVVFGATPGDWDVARGNSTPHGRFHPGDGFVHGVYAGVLGRVMRGTCEAIAETLRCGLREDPALFGRLRLHFIGTDYERPPRARKTMEPIAVARGVEALVTEEPTRLPYLTTLRIVGDADFLLVYGSDDPTYTPSKLYPYILARRPLLALLHERSGAVDVLRRTRAGEVVTFTGDEPVEAITARLLPAWTGLLRRLPYEPATDWAEFEPYLARRVAERQCRLFDRVMGIQRSACRSGEGESASVRTTPWRRAGA
jgi:hypothetical protein